MKNYDKLKDQMKIINLDGTVSYDNDLSNCISYVSSGKLVILKNYLQNVGILNELSKLIYRNIKCLYGEQKKYALKKECVYIYESLNVLSKRELESRVEIKQEAYANSKLIEYKCAVNVSRRYVLPAILNQLTQLGDTNGLLSENGIKNKGIKSDNDSD